MLAYFCASPHATRLLFSIQLQNGNEGLSLHTVCSASILLFVEGDGVITVTQPGELHPTEM